MRATISTSAASAHAMCQMMFTPMLASLFFVPRILTSEFFYGRCAHYFSLEATIGDDAQTSCGPKGRRSEAEQSWGMSFEH